MKALFLAALLLSSALAIAEEECWRKEIDPSTNQIYQNAAQWEGDKKALAAKRPPMPNLYKLQIVYRIGLEESRKVSRMRPDKRQHCYVGCRIANEAGLDVAVYAAYYKEDKDINDCNPRTHYDLNDITATIAGAVVGRQAAGQADDKYCNAKCAGFY